MLHDNARAHSAVRTQEHLRHFGWTVLDHHPFSSDLAPSDYHLFPTLKKFLGGAGFMNDDKLVKYVRTYFQKLPTTFYEEWILKLIKRYDKCLNRLGQCVEK